MPASRLDPDHRVLQARSSAPGSPAVHRDPEDSHPTCWPTAGRTDHECSRTEASPTPAERHYSARIPCSRARACSLKPACPLPGNRTTTLTNTVPQRAFDPSQKSCRPRQRPGVHHGGLPASSRRLSSGLNDQQPSPARDRKPSRSLHSTRCCSAASSTPISPATNSILSRSNGSSARASSRSTLSASSDRPNRCRVQVPASFSTLRPMSSIRVCTIVLALFLLLLNSSSTAGHPPEVFSRSPA